MALVKVYEPNDEADLAFIRSLLDAEKIPYFVHNDRFGSLEVGPRIDLFNAKAVMVPEEEAERARQLILDLNEAGKSGEASCARRLTLFDRIRIVLETVIFGWFIPGRGRSKESK